jgi:hypothetical protein
VVIFKLRGGKIYDDIALANHFSFGNIYFNDASADRLWRSAKKMGQLNIFLRIISTSGMK